MDSAYYTEEASLEHILAAQEHCDHYLTPLADVAGKSVLVVGAGAGTEILWCLRHGAREVLGIDLVRQSTGALESALAREGIQGAFGLEQVGIHEAPRLGRTFDLVLANNVFEHVSDLTGAFVATGQLVGSGGRAALFSSPLYHSSRGPHLPVEPWEHLWADEEELRARLLAGPLPTNHPLTQMPLRHYLDHELTLNRARVADFVAGIAASGLAVLNARLIADENLPRLPEFRERLAAANVSPLDLSVEGIALELVNLEVLGGKTLPTQTTEQQQFLRQTRELEAAWRADVDVLHAVERSWSFRLGRLLTAPGRWLRSPRRPKPPLG